MTISLETATTCMNAIAYTLTRSVLATDSTLANNPELVMAIVEPLTAETFLAFCKTEGIDEVADEEESEEFDIPDDVDETNYDPYAGCDIYEYYDPADGDW